MFFLIYSINGHIDLTETPENLKTNMTPNYESFFEEKTIHSLKGETHIK